MYKRVFLLIFDSLGIGNGKDAKKFKDFGSNTLNSVLSVAPYNLPCLKKLGLLNLATNLAFHEKEYEGIISKLNVASLAKDCISGHYEMMGLKVEKPSLTFNENGFPNELILELESKFNRKIIGNKCAKGIDIIKELGERQLATGEIIVYTNTDSSLLIAANDRVISLRELYQMGEIAREVTLKDEWKVDRVIVQSFTGTSISNFNFTSFTKEYSISPFNTTYLNNLKDAGYDVIAIGKINNIFNGEGITYAENTKSNIEAMDKMINISKNVDFTGLCFVNLGEFESSFANARNSQGYLRCLEDVDVKLRSLLKWLKDDDLLIISADHGSDPNFSNNEHTREQVPFLAYSPSLKINKGHMISNQDNLACIGATIIDNFKLTPKEHQIGKSLLTMIK